MYSKTTEFKMEKLCGMLLIKINIKFKEKGE